MATSNNLLDTSQRPAYLLAMIQRWLQFVLRVIVMVIAAIIVTLATQLRTDSGFTGATLVTLMSFGDMLATIVQSYTTLETSIGAVARLKAFSSSTEQESKPDAELLPELRWPQKGHIDVKSVSASYRSVRFHKSQMSCDLTIPQCERNVRSRRNGPSGCQHHV
jgi:ATP-binding cassette subfamily C (CFTR/MRP) protein 1